MFRICIWIPKKISDKGAIDKEEICMEVGPLIPVCGYIDPPYNGVRYPEMLDLTLDGRKLMVSNDFKILSTISSLILSLQDEQLFEVINKGLQSASEIATKQLPEDVSVCFTNTDRRNSKLRSGR